MSALSHSSITWFWHLSLGCDFAFADLWLLGWPRVLTSGDVESPDTSRNGCLGMQQNCKSQSCENSPVQQGGKIPYSEKTEILGVFPLSHCPFLQG